MREHVELNFKKVRAEQPVGHKVTAYKYVCQEHPALTVCGQGFEWVLHESQLAKNLPIHAVREGDIIRVHVEFPEIGTTCPTCGHKSELHQVFR